jgi:hypothetical protein
VFVALCGVGLLHGQAFAAEGDSLSLKIASALQDRMFMRASVLAVKVKTKSGDSGWAGDRVEIHQERVRPTF